MSADHVPLNQLDLDIEELDRRIEMHSVLHPMVLVCYTHSEPDPSPSPEPGPSPAPAPSPQ